MAKEATNMKTNYKIDSKSIRDHALNKSQQQEMQWKRLKAKSISKRLTETINLMESTDRVQVGDAAELLDELGEECRALVTAIQNVINKHNR